MYRYGMLTDTNEIIRVDNDNGLPYRYKDGKWVKDYDLAGIYSDDIPTKPLSEQEAMRRIGQA